MNDAGKAGWPRGAWLLLAVFACLAATAWARPLTLPDEGRYVGVAWEMLRSGDWLTPTLNGLPYFHKPPLFYWITAASLGLLGPHLAAARLAPLLGATLGAFAFYRFAARWGEPRTARLALLALLAQPLFFVGGQFANLDMLVAGCITATIVLFAHAALAHESGMQARGTLIAGYGMAALAVLAKGLIGMVLPGLVLFGWLAARRRWRTLAALLSWPGALVFMAIALPWFVAMQMHFDDFFNYFFVVQHFDRFAGGGFNNVHPFWFYPALLVLFCLPWWPWLGRAWQATGPDDALRVLMLTWVVVVVAFFSLPKSKLVGYVFPALPPLAWLAAHGLMARGRPTARAMQLWWGGTAAAAVVGLAAVVVLANYPLRSTRELAGAMAKAHLPGQPVFLLDRYPFDLRYYARLDGPLAVVKDWASPTAVQGDDWRRELADAGRFAPGRASSTLILPAGLGPALCDAGVAWVVGEGADTQRYPFLASAETVFARPGQTLWRVDHTRAGLNAALGCGGTPNADSARM